MKFKITALGGSGRSVTRIAKAIVDYLRQQKSAMNVTSNETAVERGPARYYADGTDEAGRWLGHGASALGLHGHVDDDDFTSVLAGRDPHTGERLITARGSAGRRSGLGVGTHTRLSPSGQMLFDAADAAAVLGVTKAEAQRMLEIGALVTAPEHGRPVIESLRRQPPGLYLAPVQLDGQLLATADELERCRESLEEGTTPQQAAAIGDGNEELPLAEAARIAGVTKEYLRRCARRYEASGSAVEEEQVPGLGGRRAYLVAHRGARGEWIVKRQDLVTFIQRREPPAVRVGFDCTLTTEKSLGVLALLSHDATRRAVLEAIREGNDWALGWLETYHAVAREDDRVIPVKGWTVASFRHYTSRALDPFPHHHNVVCNTVEDHKGMRRALDGRSLYQGAHAASALATAEMRYRLTTSLGVRWQPSRHGGWEIDGIPDEVLREFSRRRAEIEEAMRELQEAIGRGVTVDEIDRISLATRPAKALAAVEELIADWWHRAEALGFGPDDLAACTRGPVDPPKPDAAAIFAQLAAPDGLRVRHWLDRAV